VRNAYKILFGKPAGKRPRGRHGCRWEYTIMDHKGSGEYVNWIHLAGSCGDRTEPLGFISGGKFLTG